MSEYFGSSFFKEKVGEYVYDFLSPYMNRYGLIINFGISTYNDLSIMRLNGGYAGKITYENDVTKYTIFLNEKGTLILSGEIYYNRLSGIVERLNADKKSLHSFTTFKSTIYNHQLEGVKSHYSKNVAEMSRQIETAPFILTWKDIDHMLVTSGVRLQPNCVEKYKNIPAEEFANSIMQDFETPIKKKTFVKKNTNIS